MPAVVAICLVALNKPALSSAVVLGDLSIGDTIMKVEELANTLQVCLDSGAKKVLIPITSAVDLGTVLFELIGCFNMLYRGLKILRGLPLVPVRPRSRAPLYS